MARSLITTVTPVGAVPPVSLPLAALAAALTPVAADTTNFNSASFGPSGRLLLLALNTDTAGAHTVTVTSAADGLGRTGDITTYSIPAASTGNSAVAGFVFQANGWIQAGSFLYFQADSALVKFIVIPF